MLRIFSSLLCSSIAATAATTGWNQPSGYHTYDDPANWVGGVINNLFDESLTFGSLYLEFTDTLTTSGDLIFNSQQAVPNSYIYFSPVGNPGTVVFGGDLRFTPQKSSGFGARPTLYFGALKVANIDLGGVPRTFEVGEASQVATDFRGSVGNGSLIKSGAGELLLRGTNTISAIEVRGGILSADNPAALGMGPITFTGLSRFQLAPGYGGGAITNELILESGVILGAGTGASTFQSAGALQLGNTARTLTVGNTTTIAIVSGVVSGGDAAQLTVTREGGSGSLALQGDNAFAGGVKVLNGWLALGHKNALGTGALELSNGARLSVRLASSNSPALTGTNAVPNPLVITGDIILGDNSGLAGPLELSGPVDLGNANRTITTVSASTSFSGIISGDSNAGLTVGGTGGLSLAAANTFAGGISLNSGSLAIRNRLAVGSGRLTLAGGFLNLFGDFLGATAIPNPIELSGDVRISHIDDAELSGAVELSAGPKITTQGKLVLSGVISGTSDVPLRLASNGERIFLKAANTYSGGTLLENFISRGPQIRLGSPLSFGSGPVSVLSPSTLNPDVALTGANAIANPFILTSELSVIGVPALELSGTINLGDGKRKITSSNNSFLISGVIENGGLILDVTSSIPIPLSTRLSGMNTYTGTTEIRAGILVAAGDAPSGAPGVLGNATSTVVLGGTTGNSSASLQTSGPFTIARNLATVGSQTITLGGYTADLSTYTGDIALNRNVTLTAGSGGTVEFTGAISNLSGGTITKTGAGTVALLGVNIYTGSTTVSAGTLLVGNSTGSATGPGPVTVTAGELGGTGSIAGPVTIGNGAGSADATLSPGASVGTLTTGALTLLSDGVFKFELDSSLQVGDRLFVDGAVSLGNAKLIVLDLGAIVLPPGFSLVMIENRSNALTTGQFLGLSEGTPLQVGANSFVVDYHSEVSGDGMPNDVVLRSTNVPEPSVPGLMMLGGALLLRRRDSGR